MMHPPTTEQQRAEDIYLTGRSIVIEAGAGTGKTSTLVLLSRATPTLRIQFVAFNKSIVTDAGSKFPRNVTCSTAHSLAWRSVVTDEFEERMRTGKRMRSVDVANRLGVDPLRVTAYDGETKMLSSTFLAGLALRAVTRFCQTADEQPSYRHVPRVPGLDGPNREGGDGNLTVARHLEPIVRRAWSDLRTPEGGLPFTKNTAMAVFLKLWQLSRPIIGADVILYDEAQDASPVMVAVIALQTDPEFRAEHGMKPAQVVWVGDSQQQIYGFTGAVNALASVPGDDRTYLTQSFRFGDAIADVANHVLSLIPGAVLRLRGFDQVNSTVGTVADPDVILTRTNATAVRAVLDALGEGTSVHLIGGGDEVVRFARAARDLMDGVRVDHPELACFDDWSEVQDYVEQDEQGSDLKLLVGLIDEFGVQTILNALERQPTEEAADLVVSTAHKAKGREWDSVKIAADFPEDRLAKGGDEATDELRLLYVACTRARHQLDIDGVAFLRDRTIPEASTEPASPPAPRVEREAPRRSEHVGTVGGPLVTAATCESVKGMTTKFGWTHLTQFKTADGDVLKAFLDEELEPGAAYEITARVKAHGEFRGVNETTINYVHHEALSGPLTATEAQVGVVVEAGS